MVSKACFALASMAPWVPDLVLPLVHSRFLASLCTARVLPGPLGCPQQACLSCEPALTCSGLCRRLPWRLSRQRISLISLCTPWACACDRCCLQACHRRKAQPTWRLTMAPQSHLE